MKKNYVFILFAVVSGMLYSQTTLSAGDIAILQYNSDNSPETIKFVALRSMESGTTINFTDNGWRSDDTFRPNEGTDTWTASSNIACGDIITLDLSSISLNAQGDQILAYQGLSSSPTFIFAINTEGAAVWQTTASNPRTSALPLGLTNGTNAIAITEIDNAKYDSSTLVGSKSAILSAICTNANWGGSNTVNQTFTDTFTSETTWTTSWSNTPTDNYFKAIVDGDYDTSTDGDFSACELQINVGNTLTVNAGGTVTVENGIANNGTILVEDDGSVVQETEDGPNTGTDYTVERQTRSLAEEGGYTYWSSPLTTATFDDAVTAQLYYTFNASTQAWSAGSSSSSATAGVGFIATGPTSGTYPLQHTASFSGAAFNNGDVSVTLSFSNDADDTNDANLLGNPYPSALDADAFLAANTNLGGTLHFWTQNTADSVGDNTQDDYVTWNGTGGVGSCTGCTAPDGNIASGQSFFAQAIATGSVTFTNAMRVSGNNDLFYKSDKKKKTNNEERDRIWLNLTSGNDFSQMLLGFIDNATDGVDRLYDGQRFDTGKNLGFYSILDGEGYVIQGKSSLKNEEVIPLGFSTKITGNFKIEIDHLEGNLADSQIILYDKELDVQHFIKDNPYEFEQDFGGIIDDRFELLIDSDINEEVPVENKVKVFLRKRSLYVKSKKRIASIILHDIFGQALYESKKHKKRYRMPNKVLQKSNIYIVSIQFQDGGIVRRKVIYQHK